ncbi:hypothetical protein ACFPM7_23605 [Actinokineospora guangxiensis]|uniref:Serine dehydrogenase proteinase n=1 Tax=Actinokineospora guangxiensis TaxID=1490288 RepID=A0ABW0ETH2_9PSEU
MTRDRGGALSTGAIAEWERLRGRPAVVVAVHSLDQGVVGVLARRLRALGRVPAVDLIVQTFGGHVDAARRIALLVREHADDVTAVVVDRARSAGTLLCLAADRLALGPAASLGPLDPHLARLDGSQGPAQVSTADVRALAQAAADWFDLTDAAERAFALLGQRVFPGTLGALLRAERHVLSIAEDLAARQVPDAGARSRLAERLVSGYHSHDHDITRSEARELGLAVAELTDGEDEQAWRLIGDAEPDLRPRQDEAVTVGLVAAGGTAAWHRCLPPAPDRPAAAQWWEEA